MVGEPQLRVELKVNGKLIEMNEFVHKIIANLIWGILKSLRLDEEPHTAVISLTTK